LPREAREATVARTNVTGCRLLPAGGTVRRHNPLPSPLTVHGLSGVEGNAEFEENQARSSDPAESLVLVQRGLPLIALVLAGSSWSLAKDLALMANKAGAVPPVAMPDLVKLSKAQTNRWPDEKGGR